jgi:DNA polymerase (family 10)
MSETQRLAERFEIAAKLLELLGQDSFRASAHARAARAVDGAQADLLALARALPPEQARKELTKIEGIGPKIADKIIEFATTGTVAEIDQLQQQVPPGLIQLLGLQGLGPKTVRVFWTEAGVTDLASLQRIIDDGRILALPRMGTKAVEKLKGAVALAGEAGQRLPLGKAWVVAQRVREAMLKVPGVTHAQPAGSLRRGKDTVGDLDILVVTDDPASVTHAFTTMPGLRQVLAKGERRASVRVGVDVATRYDDHPDAPPSAGPTIQVDLRVIDKPRLGAALCYFTGSKEHNVRLRQRALDMGLTLNEYGLFPNDPSADKPPQDRGIAPIAAETEEQIHKALGLVYVPPELREDRGETDLTQTPRLVELADIRAELHAHTTASDGVMSIVQLATEAKSRGFHTIAVTDHSQSSALAGGLKPKDLRAHVHAIRAAREQVPGITILAGSEVDILADGSLDYDDDLLAELDVVVASPHAALTQDAPTATKRLLKAIAHPLVNILGHPTGRLILRRKGLEPDMAELVAAAKAHEVALEINSHWMRLDLRDAHVRAATLAGCKLAIDCDVHHPSDFDNLQFGITTARRGWLTPEHCVNTWEAPRLHAWLKRGR